jgi:hypothetical protein
MAGLWSQKNQFAGADGRVYPGMFFRIVAKPLDRNPVTTSCFNRAGLCRPFQEFRIHGLLLCAADKRAGIDHVTSASSAAAIKLSARVRAYPS